MSVGRCSIVLFTGEPLEKFSKDSISQIQVSTDLLLLGDVAVREVDKLRALHMDQNFSSEGDRLVLFAMVK